MKLCTVVWGRKTKIEFVGDQNPVMPSPILPPNRKNYNGAYGEIFFFKIKTVITRVVRKIES